MASEVLMPALSPTMTEGKLARWVKSEGDTVRAGDVLAEIETDKATMEVEAVDEGVLAKIVIPEGTDHVAVNTPIALITEDGDDVEPADGSRDAAVISPPRPRSRSGAEPGRPAPAPPDQRAEATPPPPAPAQQTRAPAQPARAETRPVPGGAPATSPEEYAGKTVMMTVRE